MIPLIITACSGSNNNKEEAVTSSNSVNSALVPVSEVVGVGKVEPEKRLSALQLQPVALLKRSTGMMVTVSKKVSLWSGSMMSLN